MDTTDGLPARHNYVRRLEMSTLDSKEDQLFCDERGYPCRGKGGPQQQADQPAVASLQPPQVRNVQSLEQEMSRLALQGSRDEVHGQENISRDAEDDGRYDYGHGEGGIATESESIRTGPVRRGQVAVFQCLKLETTEVDSE
jgi:hypothetical protein